MFVFLVEIAEVFAVVSTWSVLLSAVLGHTLWPVRVVGRRHVLLDAAFGFRRPPRHAHTLVFCEWSRKPVAVAQMLLSENRHVFWWFQNKRNRSCWP